MMPWIVARCLRRLLIAGALAGIAGLALAGAAHAQVSFPC